MRLHLPATVAALGAAVALTTSSEAQVAALPAAYGGGGLPPAAAPGHAPPPRAVAVALVPRGDVMRVRVSIAMPCSHLGGKGAFDDLVVSVPLQPDGSFAGVQRVKSLQLGSARVQIRGFALAARATGTLDVKTLKGDVRCRSGVRTFEAKPVDPAAPLPAGGPPKPDSLLVGLSNAKASVPYGVVARISSDGSRIDQLFDTQVAHCVAKRPHRRNRHFSGVDHDLHASVVLHGGEATRTRRSHESAGERRRGIKHSRVQELTVRVTDAGLVGQVRTVDRYARTGYSDRCVGGPTVLRAVPAA